MSSAAAGSGVAASLKGGDANGDILPEVVHSSLLLLDASAEDGQKYPT